MPAMPAMPATLRLLPNYLGRALVLGNSTGVAAWLDDGKWQVDRTWDADSGVEVRDITLLMYASGLGHATLVDLLLERGASVNLQDSNGWSALMLAAYEGHRAIVRRLLSASE